MRVFVDEVRALRFDDGTPVTAASAIAPLGDGWLITQDDATSAAWRRAGSVTRVRVLPPVEGHDTFSEARGTKRLKPDLEVACPAEVDGEPAGFALFFHNYSTFLARRGLYLEDLFVVPAARGRGVGRALLAHLARLAVARGCGRLEWSVLDWNAPAIGFYRALGAAPMDEWTVFRLTGDALAALAAGAEG